MKLVATGVLALFAAVVLCGCVSDPVKMVKQQQCDRDSDGSGLFNCSIEMEQELADLINDEAINRCKCAYDKRFTFFKEDMETLKKVAKENYIYALMSANAYDKGFQVELPGWTRIQRLVSEHGFSADIYRSDSGNHTFIAYRGTDDAKDWRYANTDLDADGQYRDADMVYEQAANKFKGSKITTVGHSLGGGLAIHVSVTHENVNAITFNPSPRLFISKSDIRYKNKVTIIYETGEILTAIRAMFSTLNKIEHEKYRFNYLGGNAVSEHSMSNFAQCMYASTIEERSNYSNACKDNTIQK